MMWPFKKKPTTATPPLTKPHECSVCGWSFATPDELSEHLRTHKELFESLEKTVGKGEMRDLGETIKFEDYLDFQYTEATASDLETLILTEAGIRAWGRRGQSNPMKWVGVLLAGGIGLVIVLYLITQLMPGLLGG